MNNKLDIKIKIDNINNEKNNENNFVNLDDICLSKFNPRYTLFEKENILQLVKSEIDDNYNEIFTFKKLISLESDFSDLLELLESIKKYGFQSKTENIYIVKLEQSKYKYVVAEGNRRLMTLKLISGILTLNKEMIFDEEEHYSSEKEDYVDESKIDIEEVHSYNTNYYNQNKLKNFNDCIKLIIEINKEWKNKEIIVNATYINDPTFLSELIYEKHLSGKKTGLRPWSRSKYFADLLKKYPFGLTKKYLETQYNDLFLQSIKRSDNILLSDYKEAQFVYYVLFFGNKLEINENLKSNILNDFILNKMILLKRPSALERIHSYNKIVNLLCDEILGISEKKEFNKEYLDIKFDENNLLYFENKKINSKDLLSLIFDLYNEKKITTRPFKYEDLEDIISDLKCLVNNENFDKTLTLDELRNINPFKYSKKIVEKIIINNENRYKDSYEIESLKISNEIKDENIEFKKYIIKILKEKLNYNLKISEIEPKFVFIELARQFDSIKEEFLHAKVSTIRAIVEQFKVWLYYLCLSLDKDHEDKQNCKNHVLDKFCLGKITEITRTGKINKNINNNGYVIHCKIGDYFKKSDLLPILEKNIINKINDEADVINFFCELVTYNGTKNEMYDSLNELVHSFGKRYLDIEKYTKDLKNFKLIYKNINKMLKIFDFNCFNEFNEKIIRYFREKNNYTNIKND